MRALLSILTALDSWLLRLIVNWSLRSVVRPGTARGIIGSLLGLAKLTLVACLGLILAIDRGLRTAILSAGVVVLLVGSSTEVVCPGGACVVLLKGCFNCGSLSGDYHHGCEAGDR